MAMLFVVGVLSQVCCLLESYLGEAGGGSLACLGSQLIPTLSFTSLCMVSECAAASTFNDTASPIEYSL